MSKQFWCIEMSVKCSVSHHFYSSAGRETGKIQAWDGFPGRILQSGGNSWYEASEVKSHFNQKNPRNLHLDLLLLDGSGDPESAEKTETKETSATRSHAPNGVRGVASGMTLACSISQTQPNPDGWRLLTRIRFVSEDRAGSGISAGSSLFESGMNKTWNLMEKSLKLS